MNTRKLLLTAAILGSASVGIAAFAAPPSSQPTQPTPAATPGKAKPAAPAAGDPTMMSDDMMAANGAAPAKKPVSSNAASVLDKQQLAFFEGKIRPLLVEACYKCHSAADGKAKGGLTLDTRDGWMKGGDLGPSIVPGDPEKSLLIKAVGYHDADLQMPPKEKLTDAQIKDLTTWIKMGAPDPRVSTGAKLTGLTDAARAHWAYQPVKATTPPAVANAAWVKTPVDNFVLAKLEANGMKPNHPAAREALIRRASYDLIGLPPTPEEVRAFVNDASPNAFEKVVDRLLASPHYGERWGRYWLDSARYSDTTGIENNNRGGDYRYAHAWTYRDYVINAFNADKPFDQFLKEQIAADLLPTAKADPATLAALGFITVGKRFANNNDQIDERIDALTKATMASTVACARCHDHKFDPVPTADYYSLHGIFASLVEPVEKPMIGTPEDQAKYADFEQKLSDIEAKNRDAYFGLIERNSAEFFRKPTPYMQAALLYRQQDAEGIKARNKIIAENKLDRELYLALRVQGRPDDAVFGPLMRFANLKPEDYAAKTDEILASIRQSAAAATDAPAAADAGARQRPNGKVPPAGRFGPRGRQFRTNPIVAAAFKDVKPEDLKSLADVAAVYGKMFESLRDRHAAYVKANRTATTDTVAGFTNDEVEVLSFPYKIHPAATLDGQGMTVAVTDLRLQNGGFNRFGGLSAANELMLTHPGAPARAMVINDAPVARNSPIFIRGEAQNRGPIVPRQTLAIVAGKDRKPFTQGSGRLELAESIATKDNPLTARVAINRIWAHHFGDGIVRTLDDMGTMCDPPSHPELLDYLAGRFVDGGWSVKKVHKLIMLSSAYQQSADANLSYSAKDPDNRLVWRANLRKLDFEAVRDTMLQFTGKLDPTIGGKPVNLTDEPYSFRRSVYGYIDRGGVPELMQQFDFADPDMANSKRATTIVPQQALFFMNSPMSVDVARKVTTRPEFVEAKDDLGRVKALYEVLFQRAPKAQEVALAKEFIEQAKGAVPELATPGKPNPREAAMAARKPKFVQQQVGRGGGRSAIRNSGEMVDRRPLDPWEQYAQALLMGNEIAYVN